MGDFDVQFQRQLSRESWCLYGVGMIMILMRTYARVDRLGFANLQADDYLMILAGCIYTVLIVCLNVIAQGGGSNLYEPELFPTFSPEEIQERIYGSKIVIVSEQAMLTVIYTIKSCMLIMYTRLTLGLRERQAVTWVCGYVAIGFLATELAFFLACRPFQGYWAMPPPDPQCTTLEHYAITQGVFNISSDTFMLLIPIPLLFRLRVPWRQKSSLFIVFGLGIFVILAAILTKVFNLMDVWDPNYMLWYTRESSVAIYISNLPMIWTLLKKWFPSLLGTGMLDYRKNDASGSKLSRGTNFARMNDTAASIRARAGHNPTDSGIGNVDATFDKGSTKESQSSTEQVDNPYGPTSQHPEWMPHDCRSHAMGILKSTTVHISEEHVTFPPTDFDDKYVQSWEQAPARGRTSGIGRAVTFSRPESVAKTGAEAHRPGVIDDDVQLRQFSDV